jgi:hypothetical protein
MILIDLLILPKLRLLKLRSGQPGRLSLILVLAKISQALPPPGRLSLEGARCSFRRHRFWLQASSHGDDRGSLKEATSGSRKGRILMPRADGFLGADGCSEVEAKLCVHTDICALAMVNLTSHASGDLPESLSCQACEVSKEGNTWSFMLYAQFVPSDEPAQQTNLCRETFFSPMNDLKLATI